MELCTVLDFFRHKVSVTAVSGGAIIEVGPSEVTEGYLAHLTEENAVEIIDTLMNAGLIPFDESESFYDIRGMLNFEPIFTLDGTTVVVRQSSMKKQHCVWLVVHDGAGLPDLMCPAIHLNEEGARQLAGCLAAWHIKVVSSSS